MSSEVARPDDEAKNKLVNRQEENQKKKSSRSQRTQGNSTTNRTATDLHAVESFQAVEPFTMHMDLNVVFVILVGLSFGTRMWRLTLVNQVVFDELHLGQFTNFFLTNKYFFDPNPPLGKLLYAATGYINGYDGQFPFNEIGQEFGKYEADMWMLRAVAAFLGSLVAPLVYGIIVELCSSHWAAALGAFLVIFDNMIVVSSRFVLFDSPLLFFTAASLLSFLKFHKLENSPFTPGWWIWLGILGISLMGVSSVKYSGFLTVLSVGFLVGRDLWRILGDHTVPSRTVSLHVLARGLCLVLVPAVLYILQFIIFFAVLSKAGPHDDMMSSAFQASLKGGLAKITHGQAEEVAYGSKVTLRNTFEHQCWLHSHTHTYPVKYPDGRGSSAQQQVTCYGFKDVNNWWIVKDPNRESLQVDFPPKAVKDGDIIQIIHGSTGRALNSHDVAAPLNPANQEVSCYIDYNISMAAQNLWKVEIVNPDSSNTWKTIRSQVRLVHINTSQAMKTSGQTLPEWGFQQLEVCTDRVIIQQSTIWNVEEHQQNISYPEGYNPDDHKNISSEERENITIPMPFFPKFYELQTKMLLSNKDATNEHRFSSRPSWWPFMRMGVAYWLAKDNNAQIFCLGNPFVWWVSLLALPAYVALLGMYLLRRRRSFRDLTEDSWKQFVFVGEVLVVGYLVHFVPYFLTERTLFIYNYLPAFLFNIILFPVIIEHVHTEILRYSSLRKALYVGCVFFCVVVLLAFKYFSPLTYGHVALSSADVHKRKWLKTWDLLSHPNT